MLLFFCLQPMDPSELIKSKHRGPQLYAFAVGFGFNIFTFLINLCLFAVELDRENWCIAHLDVDHTIPDDNAVEVFKENPVLAKEFKLRNNRFLALARVTLWVQLLNSAVVSLPIVVMEECRRCL